MRRHLTTALAVALAAAGSVAVPAIGQAPPKDTTPPEVSIAFSSTQLESRLLNQDVDFGLAADESVRIDAALALGARTFSEGDASWPRARLSSSAGRASAASSST